MANKASGMSTGSRTGRIDAAPSCCDSNRKRISRRVVELQSVTLVWMSIECGLSLFASWNARSPALLAFGSDSFVELLSAATVLLQFVPTASLNERTATRFAGILLYLLAAIVIVTSLSGLIFGVQSESSAVGIGITIAALLMMPILGWRKRKLSREIGNAALAADAVQSATCAYLAGITLGGLIVNALFHLAWVDNLAALAAVPILFIEGRRAMHGEACCP